MTRAYREKRACNAQISKFLLLLKIVCHPRGCDITLSPLNVNCVIVAREFARQTLYSRSPRLLDHMADKATQEPAKKPTKPLSESSRARLPSYSLHFRENRDLNRNTYVATNDGRYQRVAKNLRSFFVSVVVLRVAS